jgi:hypothetical protein
VLERFPVAAMTRSTDPSAASPANWPMYQQFGRQRGEADSGEAKERVEPSLRREAQLKAVFGYQVGDLPRPSSTTAGCAEARLSADIGSSFISISQIAAQVSRSTQARPW